MQPTTKRVIASRRAAHAICAAAVLISPTLAYAAIESGDWGRFAFYFGLIFLILFAQACIIGAVVALIRKSSQKLRYALTFAGCATVSIGAAFPFFGWRPVLFLALGLIALCVAEHVTRDRVVLGAAPTPDESA